MTTNDGKFREISRQMSEHGYELEHLKTPYPELQAESLEMTIIPGLKWLISRFGRTVMIDDSGLFIEALNGFPGVYSSFVFKSIGCDGILRLMDRVENRDARFECCVGFARPGREPFVAKGTAKGSIAVQKSGSSGFGYDPVFVPEGHNRTYAQMEVTEKNRISHRGKAIASLLAELPRLLE